MAVWKAGAGQSAGQLALSTAVPALLCDLSHHPHVPCLLSRPGEAQELPKERRQNPAATCTAPTAPQGIQRLSEALP